MDGILWSKGMSIGYIVSTNIMYMDVTLPKLLASMEKIGIPHSDVVIFVGRHGHYLDKRLDHCYRHVYLPYGGFEKTALIGATEVDLPFSHAFLLHDTCVVGERFHERIQNGTNLDADVTSTNNALCDFGAYRVAFLKHIAPYLHRLKDMTKHTAIAEEGAIYRQHMGITAEYPHNGRECEIIGHADPYKTGVARMIEYYPAIDMYKYKANYGQTNQSNYIVNI